MEKEKNEKKSGNNKPDPWKMDDTGLTQSVQLGEKPDKKIRTLEK